MQRLINEKEKTNYGSSLPVWYRFQIPVRFTS